jgi:hypothetical protein
MFLHLKKGLEALPLDWIRCQDPTLPPAAFSETTDYGVDKDLQRKLAAVRTDLDSFTEVEAYSLMLSGYLMTEHQLKALDERHRKDGEPGTWGDFDVNAPRRRWRFLDLEHLMRQAPDSSDARRQELGRQLEASASTAFKIWKLSPALRLTARAAVAAALLGVGWLLRDRWGTTIQLSELSLSFNGVVLGLGLAVAGVMIPLLKWLNPQEAMRGYLGKALVALAGFVFANLHLWSFDLLYKRRGRLKRLLELR